MCVVVQEGDTIDIKGPFGKFTYEGHGGYTLNRYEEKSDSMTLGPMLLP